MFEVEHRRAARYRSGDNVDIGPPNLLGAGSSNFHELWYNGDLGVMQAGNERYLTCHLRDSGKQLLDKSRGRVVLSPSQGHPFERRTLNLDS